MVEGGGTVLTQILTAGLADELQLVVAPFFVGDACAPRFVGEGTFPVDRGPAGHPGAGAAGRRRRPAEVRVVAALRRDLSGSHGVGRDLPSGPDQNVLVVDRDPQDARGGLGEAAPRVDGGLGREARILLARGPEPPGQPLLLEAR